MSTALAVIEPEQVALLPAMSMTEAQSALAGLATFVKAQLKEGEDFGVIPGTKKPSLYQSGAQKIAFYFGLSFEPALEREIMTAEFVSKTYVVRARDRRTGKIVAGCAGSCNSAEERFYKKIWEGKKCVGVEPMYRDARQTENTCDKMAQKRGAVGAVLIATRASGIFTQDVEDLPREQLAKEEAITSQTEIPFGKTKGTKIVDLDIGYLEWAVQPGRKFGARTAEWVKAFEAEIARRADAAADAVEVDEDLPF